MNRLHKNICAAVVETLQNIFVLQQHADKAIEATLKKDSRWGSRDRKFIAENTYEIVRWMRYIENVGQIYQANNFWPHLATWLVIQHYELPQWPEFEHIDRKIILTNLHAFKSNRAINESIPDHLDKLCFDELGAKWDAELPFLNEPAKLVIRVNTLKVKLKSLQNILKTKYGLDTIEVEGAPEALVFEHKPIIFHLEEYKKGYFEIQDASSQLVSHFLQVKPGMYVIDACAGAGGKSLHLASRMGNQGKILSMDVEKWKLQELMRRASKAGATIIETHLIKTDQLDIKHKAQRLLLDVPCSGIGVLRRNPDSKWKLTSEYIDAVKQKQSDILNRYHHILAPKGLMVYATCSILPSENQGQVYSFIQNMPQTYELIDEKTIWPSSGFDGFYMALIQKK